MVKRGSNALKHTFILVAVRASLILRDDSIDLKHKNVQWAFAWITLIFIFCDSEGKT